MPTSPATPTRPATLPSYPPAVTAWTIAKGVFFGGLLLAALFSILGFIVSIYGWSSQVQEQMR